MSFAPGDVPLRHLQPWGQRRCELLAVSRRLCLCHKDGHPGRMPRWLLQRRKHQRVQRVSRGSIRERFCLQLLELHGAVRSWIRVSPWERVSHSGLVSCRDVQCGRSIVLHPLPCGTVQRRDGRRQLHGRMLDPRAVLPSRLFVCSWAAVSSWQVQRRQRGCVHHMPAR